MKTTVLILGVLQGKALPWIFSYPLAPHLSQHPPITQTSSRLSCTWAEALRHQGTWERKQSPLPQLSQEGCVLLFPQRMKLISVSMVRARRSGWRPSSAQLAMEPTMYKWPAPCPWTCLKSWVEGIQWAMEPSSSLGVWPRDVLK